MLVRTIVVLLIQHSSLQIVAKIWVVEYPIQPSVFVRRRFFVALYATHIPHKRTSRMSKQILDLPHSQPRTFLPC